MRVNRTNLLKKICAVTLAAAMLAGAGLTEAGTYIGTAVQVDAVTSSSEETPASSFKYEEDYVGGITITKFIGDETNVVIPSKIDGKAVTSIGGYVFSGCTSLTNITIPDSVTSIGYSAFSGCTNLEKVIIGNGVTSIGEWAFYGCTNLENVTISKGVTSIGDYAFNDCTSLKEINVDKNNKNYSSENGVLFNKAKTTLIKYPSGKTDTEYSIPDSVTSIDFDAFSDRVSFSFSGYSLEKIAIPDSVTNIRDSTFEYCISLKEINVDKNNKNYSSENGVLFNKDKTTLIKYPSGKTDTEYSIPNSVTSIGNRAFQYCTSLKKAEISNSVTSIEYGAFWGCTSLKEVTIGNSVTSIKNVAFEYCTSLEKVTIPNNVTSIGNSAFASCTNLKEVTIPDSVTSIGWCVFAGCTSLKKVTIGNSVTSIDGTFKNCTSLKTVTIGNSVTSIENSAFYGCTNLEKVEIPNSVTSIDSDAFNNCTSLKEINIDKNNKNYNSVNGVLFNKDKTTLIKYPEGKADTEYSIPKSVTSIGNRAFVGCTNLEKLEIPNSVTSIENWVFVGCTSLEKVTIPNSVTSIESGEFYGCTSLTKVTIPNSVTSIGKWAFSDCTSLTEVTIPNSVTSIGERAFRGCTSLEKVTIPDSITSIGNSAFSGCTNLKEINVDKNNKNYSSVNGVLFNKDRTTLIRYPSGKTDDKYSIPNGVTSIEYGAFSSCTSLKEINVDKNNKNYSSVNGVLFNKTKTTLIQYPKGKANTEYSIPNSVTSIESYAFGDCTNLEKIEISNSVKIIENTAFNGCTSLKEVTISDSVTSIGGWAFDNCTNLTSIIIPNNVVHIDTEAFGYIYNDFSEKYEKISNFTIYGTKGSEAENYAITNDFMFIDVSELSEQKKSDGNTNVSVYGNIPKTAKLNVKSVSTDVKNAVLAYDITLTKDNKEIEPVGEVTVSIPCDTPDLKVVWLHNGEQTDMNAAYADGKYTFKVSHFSTYVLVKDGLFGKINGDTNGDGKVNIADALMIARYDAKLTTLNDAQISVSDVNGDSKVNIADALKIARYDAKLIDSLD